MQQMKLKWLLREVSAHINHATLRAAVFGSGCASAVLALGAGGGGGCLWLPRAGRGRVFLLFCLRPGVSQSLPVPLSRRT